MIMRITLVNVWKSLGKKARHVVNAIHENGYCYYYLFLGGRRAGCLAKYFCFILVNFGIVGNNLSCYHMKVLYKCL